MGHILTFYFLAAILRAATGKIAAHEFVNYTHGSKQVCTLPLLLRFRRSHIAGKCGQKGSTFEFGISCRCRREAASEINPEP